jgi:DNA adenine methylase
MIGYIGGKQGLAPQLLPMFPSHLTYVEPFCGMAHVFMRKPASKIEVLNDRNEEVVNFLRVCQLHHPELLRHLRYAVASRRLFDLYRSQDAAVLTDVQRAARFLYLQKSGFGGKVVGRTYGNRVTSRPAFNPVRLPEILERVARRLERVQLEYLPYEEVLQRYDREATFFYCDPPYIGTRLYRYNFNEEDYADLSRRLADLKGKFLLSINDHPLARATFRQFHCAELTARYNVGPDKNMRVKELVFSNYNHEQQKEGRADHVGTADDGSTCRAA